MKTSDITDPLFLEAVEAIDAGDISKLKQLLQEHPRLVKQRIDVPEEGYFKHPYLLWFVADNPVRYNKLPVNIVEVTNLLIKFVQQNAVESFQEQIDYTLGLIATGRIARECGVQINLIDLLIDNGAIPGDGHDAFAHGNIEAAKHIIERSGKITLTAAICLNRVDDVKRLLPETSVADKQVVLIAAAFYGKSEMIELLINSGVDVNAYINNGFHTHASALHQAVSSGSLDAVKILVQAGASLNAEDKIYYGTPLGWAIYLQIEEINEDAKKRYAAIESFLFSKMNK